MVISNTLDMVLLIPPVLYYTFVSIQALTHMMQDPMQYAGAALVYGVLCILLFWAFSALKRWVRVADLRRYLGESPIEGAPSHRDDKRD